MGALGILHHASVEVRNIMKDLLFKAEAPTVATACNLSEFDGVPDEG